MKKLFASLLVLAVVVSILVVPIPAQATSILADDIWAVLNGAGIPEATSGFTTNVAVIFNKADTGAYDTAMQTCAAQSKWTEGLLIKRICELAGYESSIVEIALLSA